MNLLKYFKTRTRLFSFLVVLLIVISTLLFYTIEDWTLIQSFYFTVTTLTTVGFGDLVPSSEGSRLATAIFMLFGIGAFVTLLSFIETSMAEHRTVMRERLDRRIGKERNK